MNETIQTTNEQKTASKLSGLKKKWKISKSGTVLIVLMVILWILALLLSFFLFIVDRSNAGLFISIVIGVSAIFTAVLGYEFNSNNQRRELLFSIQMENTLEFIS